MKINKNIKYLLILILIIFIAGNEYVLYKVDNVNTTIKQLNYKIENLNSRKDSLLISIDKLENTFVQNKLLIKKNIDIRNKKYKSNLIDHIYRLNLKLGTSEDSVQILNNIIIDLDSNIVLLKDNLNEKSDSIRSIMIVNVDLNQEIFTSNKEKRDIVIDNTRLGRELTISSDSISKLNIKINEGSTLIRSLNAEISNNSKQIIELKSSLKTATDSINTIDSLQKELIIEEPITTTEIDNNEDSEEFNRRSKFIPRAESILELKNNSRDEIKLKPIVEEKDEYVYTPPPVTETEIMKFMMVANEVKIFTTKNYKYNFHFSEISALEITNLEISVDGKQIVGRNLIYDMKKEKLNDDILLSIYITFNPRTLEYYADCILYKKSN